MYNKKKLKKFINVYGTITMLEFLVDYVGIRTQFNSLRKATHKDIKFLCFEGVESVPFQIVDNDDLAIGRYILVEDCHHHIGVYKNPLFINSTVKIDSNKEKSKNRILLKSMR